MPAGEAIDDLRREHRADIDELRLAIEVRRRCLTFVHPHADARDEALREQVRRETDPESS